MSSTSVAYIFLYVVVLACILIICAPPPAAPAPLPLLRIAAIFVGVATVADIVVAIVVVYLLAHSIQNGDFISIYVDCSWTNSFVVSKRLFTLPMDADVEIGRGFNVSIGRNLKIIDKLV